MAYRREKIISHLRVLLECDRARSSSFLFVRIINFWKTGNWNCRKGIFPVMTAVLE